MRIVIVGDGKIGSALAEQLSREGHEITIVDRSETPLQRTVEDLDILSIEGNGATYATQMEAGVDEAELVIAVTAQDELNLLCCLIAKKIGAKHTIARVRNPEYAEELSLISDDLGLSLSVNPELICATEMARTLRTPSAIKTDTFFGGKVELLKFQLPADSPLAVRSGVISICIIQKQVRHAARLLLRCALYADGWTFVFVHSAKDRKALQFQGKMKKLFSFCAFFC